MKCFAARRGKEYLTASPSTYKVKNEEELEEVESKSREPRDLWYESATIQHESSWKCSKRIDRIVCELFEFGRDVGNSGVLLGGQAQHKVVR